MIMWGVIEVKCRKCDEEAIKEQVRVIDGIIERFKVCESCSHLRDEQFFNGK